MNRPIEVLEPMLSEITEVNFREVAVGEQGRSRLRKQHLAPVRDRTDACSTVDPETDVAVLRDERFGRVDTLVNNAGIFIPKPFVEYSEADFAAMISVNLAGFFHVSRRAAREMLRRYPKANVAKFDGKADTQPTELDALVAYLQVLGTLVDFATFDASGPNSR